jgi:tetratricopeptide (TPR) repeat protein
LGKAYEELGQYTKAEQHAARAVQLRLDHLGPEHADTIAAQNALGWVLYRQGKSEEARTLMTPVLKAARKALRPEHPETLQAMHVLAAVLDKPDEARALGEELLALRKRVLGPRHPKTLATMNNLAFMLRGADIGDREKARRLFEQVLAIELRDLPNHPYTFITMGNLVGVYSNLNQYDRAIDMSRRAMEGNVRVLGLAHPFTQDSIGKFLGQARRDRAHWDEAQKVLEPLLDRTRRELDGVPENRDTLNASEALARSLYLTGHRDAALVQFQRVEAVRPRFVPADDPFGLWVRTRLALVLRVRGRLAEARPLLEQTVAEAQRLRKEASKPSQTIEEARSIAQLLLRQWPGLAPGISPAARPPAPFTIEAPFRATGPVADGRIDPGEYGPAIEATFDGDANPGRMYLFLKSRSKTPDDLSVRVHTAYTPQSLFLAFRVRDQFVDAGEGDAKAVSTNDDVEVYINGDQVANDFVPKLGDGGCHPFACNREGFILGADAGGHQETWEADFTNADWKVGTSRTPDGYIIEFEIPLALIDTRDGPEYVPATGGDQLRVNFAFTDNDASVSGQTDLGIFWAEDPALSPTPGGEDFWTVSLRLVPKPTGP